MVSDSGVQEDQVDRRKLRPNYAERMVSRAGLEPATTALKVRCSTN